MGQSSWPPNANYLQITPMQSGFIDDNISLQISIQDYIVRFKRELANLGAKRRNSCMIRQIEGTKIVS